MTFEGEYSEVNQESFSVEVVSEAVNKQDWSFLRTCLTRIVCTERYPSSLREEWLIKLLKSANEEQSAHIWSAAKEGILYGCQFNRLVSILDERLSTTAESDMRVSVGEMMEFFADYKVFGLPQPYDRRNVLGCISEGTIAKMTTALFHVARFDDIGFAISLLEQNMTSAHLLIRASSISGVGSFFTRADISDEAIAQHLNKINEIIETGERDVHWFVRRGAKTARELSQLG